MAEAYRQNEQSVHIIALNTDKHRQLAATIEKATPAGLSLEAIPVSTRPRLSSALANLLSPKPYQVSRFNQKKVKQALRTYFQRNTCDFIQLEGLSMLEYLPLLRELSSAPLLLRAHNIEHHIWERHLYNEKNGLLRLYLRLQNRRLKTYEQRAFQKVDGILFISKEDRAAYEQLQLNTASYTIPCGISGEPLPSYPPADYDLSYLASFDWLPNRQGMEWFVDQVWPLMRAERPQLRMLLAGRHIPAAYYRWKDQGIDVLGEVADPGATIKRGKISVVPLLAGSGMRVKLLENLALAQAMVVSPQAAEGLPVKHEQELILAADPLDLARRSLELLTDDRAARQLGRNGRDFALQYYRHKNLGKEALKFIGSL